MRVLIDAGMGASRLAPLKKWGVDILVLSHCHMDHRLTYREIADVPVWCHAAEASFLSARSLFLMLSVCSEAGLTWRSISSAPMACLGSK
ncbi:MAG: hypothetical protein JRE18_00955, partial [Deltaproteobacteria bacterium]|nr:hypothetical protein [Deltaproteobacteria bacterium]